MTGSPDDDPRAAARRRLDDDSVAPDLDRDQKALTEVFDALGHDQNDPPLDDMDDPLYPVLVALSSARDELGYLVQVAAGQSTDGV